MGLLFIATGGFLGAILRYLLSAWIVFDHSFPLMTLLINVLGCFILGIFSTREWKRNPQWTLFFTTGVLGSFTTFSAFSLETVQLIQSALYFQATFYVVATTVFGLLFVYVGRKFARSMKSE